MAARIRVALLLVLCACLSGSTWVGGHRRPRGGSLVDDFNACPLNQTTWQIQNASPDLVLGSVGVGSGDADLTVSISGSQTHDPWVPDTAPAFLQPLPAGNWTREVRFASQLPAVITGHGMKIADGAGNFIRADVYRSSNGTNFFIGFITPTTPTTIYNALVSSGQIAPLRIRVVYTAGSYDVLYSSDDGATYQRPAGFAPFTEPGFTPTKAGFLVANALSGGSTPAYTAKVDWWNVAAGAPAGEDSATFSGHTLTTSTAGTGTGTVAKAPSQSSYACGDTVSVTATPGGGSVFSGWSGDLTGTINPGSVDMTVNRSVTATFTLGSNPPAMALSPTSISQSVTQGGNASPVSFTIANTGGGTLDWATSFNQTWATASPQFGSTTTTPSTGTLTFATASLAAGSYGGTLQVASPEVPTQTIPVSVVVNATGAKQFPDGSTDTGLNATLTDLPGGPRTCTNYCNATYGGLRTYTGSDTPAAGALIECYTWNQGFKLTHDNITIRCSDVSAPGDTNGIIKVPSGAVANSFMIEGNAIHNSHITSLCATQAITIYQSDGGVIQQNDVSDVSDMYVQPGQYAFPVPVLIQWNWNHNNVSSDTCAGSHDESIHEETGRLTVLHNRFEHTTAAQGFSGTACVRSESNPGKIVGGEWGWNLFQGGGSEVTADGGDITTGQGENWHDNVFVNGAWQFQPFVFAHTPASFSGNKCDNGHPLTLSSTNCTN